MNDAAAETTAAPQRPLAGRTVVVTRPREQAASLARPLEAQGAEVLIVPTIRIVPLPFDEAATAAVSALSAYDLVIFTSANAVDVFFGYLGEAGAGSAALAATTVATIGPATSAALAARGVTCDLVPDDYVAEGLLEVLGRRGVVSAAARVLIPSAREARAVLAEGLRAGGAVVDVLPVYDTVAADGLSAPAARIESADYITFTSSSTAQRFAALMEAAEDAGASARPLAERLSGVRLCSIGPVTSATLRELGLAVALEARESTSAGLAAAIVRDARGG